MLRKKKKDKTKINDKIEKKNQNKKKCGEKKKGGGGREKKMWEKKKQNQKKKLQFFPRVPRVMSTEFYNGATKVIYLLGNCCGILLSLEHFFQH